MRPILTRVLVVCSLLLADRVFAQGEQDSGGTPAEGSALNQTLTRLAGLVRSAGGWDTFARDLNQSADRTFEHAGWDSEEDLFALTLVHSLNELPPWDFQGRLNVLTDGLADRYQLDEQQRAHLSDMIEQATTELVSRHSERILGYAGEILQARAGGDPFTPEQVARWTEQAGPVFDDATKMFNRRVEEFARELRPAQRDLLERDVKADRHRQEQVRGMMDQWRKGNWTAADWGLDADPIQQRNAVMATALSGKTPPPASGTPQPPAGATEQPSKPDHQQSDDDDDDDNSDHAVQTPHVEQPASRPVRPTSVPADDWARYVLSFIERFSLDDEQQQRAWQMYRESSIRKDEIVQRSAKTGKKPDTRTNQQIERAFDQLKLRLERLPTRAQRAAATPGKAATPAKGKPSPR